MLYVYILILFFYIITGFKLCMDIILSQLKSFQKINIRHTRVHKGTDSYSCFSVYSGHCCHFLFRFDKKCWVNNWKKRQAALEPSAYQSFIAWKIVSVNIWGQWDTKYHHRYVFAEYTDVVKLCCSHPSIYILIRLSVNTLGRDGCRFESCFKILGILTKVYWSLWSWWCQLLDLKS